MKQFKIYCSKNLPIAKMEDTMFSSFIEHLGRAVYGGIYQPGQKTADEDGFRQDVIDVLKPLSLELVRYPGGNFVSGYFWEDGIGPKDKRPTKKEEAWRSIEPNQVGTDEFMKWTKKLGTHTMMAVNMGTGTTESARNLVEYCNSNGDGKYANLRRQYGAKEAYKVKYWGIGNEMDGEWQIGHLNSVDYAKKAKEAAEKMKAVDPDIKLIACGSSTFTMATFPEWDRVVLDTLYDDVDYLSVHQYFFEDSTEANFYASNLAMEKYIGTLRHLVKYLKAKHRSEKEIYLCFDEYNIWYNNKKLQDEYVFAPALFEEDQSMKDALVFSGIVNSLINNCDVIKIACLAQLVNVISPIITNDETVKLNTTWYQYLNFCKYNRGTALKSFVTLGDTFDSIHGKACYVTQSVTYNDKEIAVTLTNYAKEKGEVEVTLDGFKDLKVIEHQEMRQDNLNDNNTFENPNNVVPHLLMDAIEIDGNVIKVKINDSSYNFIRLSYK